MGTVIVVILVVAIIVAAVVFLQPRLREGGRLGDLAGRFGRRPAAGRNGGRLGDLAARFGRSRGTRREAATGRGPDGVGSRREERRLMAEGEAIRDRVEADLAETPPKVRARDLASRGAGEMSRPVEEPHAAPGHGVDGPVEEAYADDPEGARRAEERRLREVARARRGGGGGGRSPRIPPADGEGRRR